MRLVHLADLHLGFRQFQRVAKSGINVREADVARAFRDAIDRAIGLAPELVVVAGDVFHGSRPPNNAIVHALREFARLTTNLPNTPIVIVAGNHDATRTIDTGNILPAFETLGIHVASFGARRLIFPDLELAVLAVPDVFGVRPQIEPDIAQRYNVLVLHGEVEYVAPDAGTHPWDYVALGHYHVHREVAPRAYYSGSIDYTSSNVWGELAEEQTAGVPGKGLIEYDLDQRRCSFHQLPAPRGFVELPAIDARDKTPAEIDAVIRGAVDACPGGIEQKVVRLTIRDIPRAVACALDQRTIRSYRNRALNFLLVMEKPVEVSAGGVARPVRQRLSLSEIVRESIAKRALPGDMDRNALAELALKFLDRAETRDVTTEQPAEANA